MANLEYGKVYGVFSEKIDARLDIGTDAMKKITPISWDSFCTRLKIKRLDGESRGPISDSHLIGIFSEDNSLRLDLGSTAMKKVVSERHESWATQLVFKRLDGPNNGEIKYGDLVGVFSSEGNARLDIGDYATKINTLANVNTPTTRLRIMNSNPIVQLNPISIEYRVKQAKIISFGSSNLFFQTLNNNTDTEQSICIEGSETITETSGWSDTLSVSVGAKASIKVKIPFVGETGLEVSASLTNSYTWNGSVSTQRMWKFNVPLKVPAYGKVSALIKVSISDIEVPYDIKCNAIYASGKEEIITISGIYLGSNSHNLHVTFEKRYADNIISLEEISILDSI